MDCDKGLFIICFLGIVFGALFLLGRPPSATSGLKRRRRLFQKERRENHRYKTSLRIKYKTPSLEEGASWIRDISENGARLFLTNTLKALKIGTPLEIEIDIPQLIRSVSLRGNIVWSQENDAGLRFEEISEGELKKVLQYVTRLP